MRSTARSGGRTSPPRRWSATSRSSGTRRGSSTRTRRSAQDAANALKTTGQSDPTELFDAQLLAAWLNFANGAYDLDELVDTTGDGVADTEFLTFMVQAETVRLDPTSTHQDLFPVKDALERLNNP